MRANSLQAAEFNLRLVATSIETSLDSADALLNWASIDSTVRRYISQENINGTQTIAAYEAVQEKYYSSTLYSHILRFFITGNTYQGRNGYSLLLDGLEKGINDRARERAIVVHGAAYANPSVCKSGRLGRSFGCPALPQALTKEQSYNTRT